MKKNFPFLAVALACLCSAQAGQRTLTDFDEKENESLGWRIVNDGVMGGLSKGSISYPASGILKFSGKLSLENNGGFSSLRTDDLELDLGDYSGLSMRVKGDGRTYQVRLSTDARYRFSEVSFMADFATEAGKWIEVQVPFSELTGSWRGRTLEDKVFDPKKVRRLGLLLADKKPGDFALEVDWIRATSGGSDKPKNIAEVAIADGRFKTLVAALTAAELVDVVSGKDELTVFAPTDEAFAKLPEETLKNLLKPENRSQLQAILKYHVVASKAGVADALKAGNIATVQGEEVQVAFKSGRVMVNDASLLIADIACSNGVIHVIDSVLLPPTPKPERKTLVNTAKAAGSFSTLLAAAEAAGLVSLLEGDDPLTVFAPTDKAFARLPNGTVKSLLKEENRDQLKAILAYHVVPGRVSAGDALNAKSAKSANGQELSFAIVDGRFRVNESNILTTDIDAGNGVIHVIDSVLLPKKSETTNSSPREQIEAAIDRGVPVFNRGDKAACAAIYQECLTSLATDERLQDGLRDGIKQVLDRVKDTDDAGEQAWGYRRALDVVYEFLEREQH